MNDIDVDDEPSSQVPELGWLRNMWGKQALQTGERGDGQDGTVGTTLYLTLYARWCVLWSSMKDREEDA